MKKLKIAMVAACPFPGNRGTPSRILRMAEALSDVGHKVSVITYHFGTDAETRGIEIHRILKIPYSKFSPGPSYTKLLVLDPLLFFKLLKVVREGKFDIIHAHHFEGALVGYLVRKMTGIQVIYDAHTTLEGELSYYNLFQPRWLSDLIERKVPQWSNHIIAVSDELKMKFIDIGINNPKIDVIPTGVNLNFFDVTDDSKIKNRYNLHDRKIVMYTGSLAAFQGVDYLIEAMERVFDSNKNVVLVLVGNSDIKKYKQICSEKGILDKVLLTGPRPFNEIPFFLAAADVVVNPRTICPGMPQKLVNYMAAKKAIVSFEGSAKLITHNHNGIIVKNADVSAMAASICELLVNAELRQKLGDNALSTLINKYDWCSLARKTEKIYYRLMN